MYSVLRLEYGQLSFPVIGNGRKGVRIYFPRSPDAGTGLTTGFRRLTVLYLY